MAENSLCVRIQQLTSHDSLEITLIFLLTAVFIANIAQQIVNRLSPWIQLPYSVVLVIFGLILAQLGRLHIYAEDEHFSRYLDLPLAISKISCIDPHVIFLVILPPLLYESAINVKWHVFKKVLPSSLILAGPGVLINVFLIGSFFWVLLPASIASWPSVLLAGSILAATDPVAVVAALESLGAPHQLASLIEGESLFNDGSAVVMYYIFHDLVLTSPNSHCTTGEAGCAIGDFFRLSLGGPILGMFMGFCTSFLISFVPDDSVLELSVILLSVWSTFFISEYSPIRVSGVLAVVVLGLYMNARGCTKITAAETEKVQHIVLHRVTYLCNQLLFLIAGIVSSKFLLGHDPLYEIPGYHWALLIALYVVLHISRILVNLLFYPLMRRIGYGARMNEIIFLSLTGLRGAISLALVLMLHADIDLYGDEKTRQISAIISFHVSGVALMTLLFNGTAAKLLYVTLKIQEPNPYLVQVFPVLLKAIEDEFMTQAQSMDHTMQLSWFLGSIKPAHLVRFLPSVDILYAGFVGNTIAFNKFDMQKALVTLDISASRRIKSNLGSRAQEIPQSDWKHPTRKVYLKICTLLREVHWGPLPETYDITDGVEDYEYKSNTRKRTLQSNKSNQPFEFEETLAGNQSYSTVSPDSKDNPFCLQEISLPFAGSSSLESIASTQSPKQAVNNTSSVNNEAHSKTLEMGLHNYELYKSSHNFAKKCIAGSVENDLKSRLSIDDFKNGAGYTRSYLKYSEQNSPKLTSLKDKKRHKKLNNAVKKNLSNNSEAYSRLYLTGLNLDPADSEVSSEPRVQKVRLNSNVNNFFPNTGYDWESGSRESEPSIYVKTPSHKLSTISYGGSSNINGFTTHDLGPGYSSQPQIQVISSISCLLTGEKDLRKSIYMPSQNVSVYNCDNISLSRRSSNLQFPSCGNSIPDMRSIGKNFYEPTLHEFNNMPSNKFVNQEDLSKNLLLPTASYTQEVQQIYLFLLNIQRREFNRLHNDQYLTRRALVGLMEALDLAEDEVSRLPSDLQVMSDNDEGYEEYLKIKLKPLSAMKSHIVKLVSANTINENHFKGILHWKFYQLGFSNLMFKIQVLLTFVLILEESLPIMLDVHEIDNRFPEIADRIRFDVEECKVIYFQALGELSGRRFFYVRYIIGLILLLNLKRSIIHTFIAQGKIDNENGHVIIQEAITSPLNIISRYIPPYSRKENLDEIDQKESIFSRISALLNFKFFSRTLSAQAKLEEADRKRNFTDV